MTMMRTALTLTLMAASTLSAADWNQWRGPNRDGAAPQSPRLIEALPDEGLKPLWKVEGVQGGGSGGWGSPVIANGRVYLYTHEKVIKPGARLEKAKYPWLAEDKRGHLTKDEYEQYEVNRRNEDEARGKAYIFTENLYCYDARTGKQVYKSVIPSIYTRFVHSGTPTVSGGKVYFLGAGRTVRCLNESDGKVVWETKLPGEFRDEFFMSSFAIADDAAVFLAGQLYAVDTQTGKLRWTGDKSRTSGTHSSPVTWTSAGKPLVLANVAGSETLCVEPRTGKELWRVKSEGGMSTPLVRGDVMVTFGSSRKKGLRAFKLTPTGAKPLWVYQGAGDQGSSPVVVGDYVYVQGERRVACVDLNSGEEKWATQLTLRDPRYTSLLAADQKVFYACEGLLCFAATPEEFNVLYEGHINAAGVLATEQTQRRLLNLAELEKQPDGANKAESRWRSQIESKGPLKCSSPAFWDGKLYLRTNNGIVCYDLSAIQRT